MLPGVVLLEQAGWVGGRIGMDDGGAREMIGKEEGCVDGKSVSQ